MTIRRAVLTYQNPDTDGIACMFGYKELLERSNSDVIVTAWLFGSLNPETSDLLQHLGVEAPPLGDESTFSDVDEICLVDTHHSLQLPGHVPTERVVEVIDHHGGGDIQPPRAKIQNEMVGAAATLLIERFRSSSTRPSTTVAQLLVAAVLSNTLDLKAPSTTPRDSQAIEWIGLEDDELMRLRTCLDRGREKLVAGDTVSVLGSDVKVFQTKSGGALAMSQIEGPNVAVIHERPDLNTALTTIKTANSANDILVNLADSALQRSVLICPNHNLRDQLERAHDIVFDNDGHAWTPQIFLRKTHLVPVLVD